MFRINTPPLDNWQKLAEDYGFHFHTMYGKPYWDESAYYQFSLKQIEQDLEAPTEELHQMCLHVVDKVLADEQLLQKFCIPESYWDFVASSWKQKAPSLYSRLDLAYNGKGPAKLYENNADTPTSLYETGFWQWLWLEDKVNNYSVPRTADQFNSLQEKLVLRFQTLKSLRTQEVFHIACCKESEEDRGTVQYLEDCAQEAGLQTAFVFIEDIGKNQEGQLTDLDNKVITWMFKLYPWEFMFRESFGELLPQGKTHWLEPPWKAILSNKALLPVLWQLFPDHPNLLPAYFENDPKRSELKNVVRKPIFAREGANIRLDLAGVTLESSDGPYGEEGFIYQAYHPLPKFGDSYTLIGSWLVDDKAAGISVREDHSRITQDLSRYLPHVIVG